MASLILLAFAITFAVIAALFEPISRPWGRVHFGWLALTCYLVFVMLGGR